MASIFLFLFIIIFGHISQAQASGNDQSMPSLFEGGDADQSRNSPPRRPRNNEEKLDPTSQHSSTTGSPENLYNNTSYNNTSSKKEGTPLLSIRPINEESGLKALEDLYIAHNNFHQSTRERNFSGLDFADIKNRIEITRRLKQRGLNKAFGVYGFYYQDESYGSEKLVGIIKMLGITTIILGYAECEMTMHPEYRSKGLGSVFRKRFHDEIVRPLIGAQTVLCNSHHALDLERVIFHGTIGYIHANNLASRKLVTKLGHVPVRLSFKEYLTREPALQIVYAYPPVPEAEKLPAPLSQEIIQTILQMTLDIMLRL